MKQLTGWAHSHVWPARILLTLCHIITILLAWTLVQIQGGIATNLLYCALPFFVVVTLFISSRRWGSRSFHLFAATGSFWLVVMFFQAGGSLKQTLTAGQLVQQVHASKTYDKPELKKKKKTKLGFFKKLKDEKTKKTLLTLFTIVVALFILFLIAALSCSFACSGSDALALLVGIGGLIGVLLGGIAVLKRIQRGPKKKEAEIEEVKPEGSTEAKQF